MRFFLQFQVARYVDDVYIYTGGTVQSKTGLPDTHFGVLGTPLFTITVMQGEAICEHMHNLVKVLVIET